MPRANLRVASNICSFFVLRKQQARSRPQVRLVAWTQQLHVSRVNDVYRQASGVEIMRGRARSTMDPGNGADLALPLLVDL